MKPQGEVPEPDLQLDARGLLCPLPVLFAVRKLAKLPAGGVLEVIGTDRTMLEDFPELCREREHELLALEELERGEIRVVLAKAHPDGNETAASDADKPIHR